MATVLFYVQRSKYSLIEAETHEVDVMNEEQLGTVSLRETLNVKNGPP